MTGRDTGFPFPVHFRLRLAGDYRRVFSGEPYRTQIGSLTMLSLPTGHDQARVGMAIAKKSVRRAVDRNRIKRKVRESFRHEHALLPPVDVVVLARRGLADATGADLGGLLARHWQRIREHWSGSPRNESRAD